jgi:hypothetical protein
MGLRWADAWESMEMRRNGEFYQEKGHVLCSCFGQRRAQRLRDEFAGTKSVTGVW